MSERFILIKPGVVNQPGYLEEVIGKDGYQVEPIVTFHAEGSFSVWVDDRDLAVITSRLREAGVPHEVDPGDTGDEF